MMGWILGKAFWTAGPWSCWARGLSGGKREWRERFRGIRDVAGGLQLGANIRGLILLPARAGEVPVDERVGELLDWGRVRKLSI